VQRALSAFSEGEDSGEDVLRWLWLAIRGAGLRVRRRSWDTFTPAISSMRAMRGLTELPVTLARDDMRQRRRLGP
jgi:hypothetical protein